MLGGKGMGKILILSHISQGEQADLASCRQNRLAVDPGSVMERV